MSKKNKKVDPIDARIVTIQKNGEDDDRVTLVITVSASKPIEKKGPFMKFVKSAIDNDKTAKALNPYLEGEYEEEEDKPKGREVGVSAGSGVNATGQAG